ncbi:MAG: exodeoxyribonuclease VII small subunit [Rhodospirillales bacterium CG15_BIG_FIL_POST_REV_8_21_14_020_66_15]|nr:MAG: exodeoxyribonuclease VII small subunit [Rhodospirillales bacterium CG15_BIG_FIL_POST_REV_8_21_14_020_66_15]
MAKQKSQGAAADTEIPEDIRAMSFEDAMSELEDIVRGLEQGAGSLDQAIDAYSRGVALKSHCEARLKEAQLRVDKIVVGAGGSLSSEPADQE